MNIKCGSRVLLPVLLVAALVFPGVCCKGSAKAGGAKPGAAAEKTAPAIPEQDIFTCTSGGRWFPGNEAELRKMVDGFLAKAKPQKLPGRVTAIISPHAGFIYSGPVAGAAYRQIEGLRFDTVVVVGFNHGVLAEGVAVYNKGGFRTPLGVIPVDTDFANALIKKNSLIKFMPDAFSGEHSVDNQLPFLQRALGEFKLVPVLLTDQNRANVDALADALSAVAKGKNVLLVASTDMSHFWTHDEAKELDKQVLDKILALDVKGLSETLKDDPTGRRLCGRGGVEAVMRAAMTLGADKASLIEYADSSDTYGPTPNGVVGYGAVVLTASKGKNQSADAPAPRSSEKERYTGELDKNDQKQLLKIAREALEAYIRDGKQKEFTNEMPRLDNKRGVFVTLNENGDLRGCMGHFEADTPLYKIVAHQAIVSAAGDPRFNPVTADELKKISIEISVLSEPQKVDSYKDIVIGKHGVIMRKGAAGATFLPQVAPEQGWDRDTMLSNLSRKAGLDPDAWKSGATFFVYTAQVFGEEEE